MKNLISTIKFFTIIIFLTILISGGVFAATSFGPPIDNDQYTISRSLIDRELLVNELIDDYLTINNKGGSAMRVTLTLSKDLEDLIKIESAGAIIPPYNQTTISFLIIGQKVQSAQGDIIITGDISQRIPVNISIVNETEYQLFILNIQTTDKSFTLRQKIEVIIDLKKILPKEISNATITYSLNTLEDESLIILETETRDIVGSYQIKKSYVIPETINEGEYSFNVLINYQNRTVFANTSFSIRTPFWQIKIFNSIPLWLLALLFCLITLGIIIFIIIHRELKKRRRYKMEVNTRTLPKKTDKTLYFGKVAEKNFPAYYDMDRLTTHAVVAGATGGGKSITAQVLIEEALLKNIAVIVFDPTAQWSGMLRKCDDKKMIDYYTQFGLKATDARAFPGNVRQVENARQVIDINKHLVPGQIHIFTLNKLDPSEMDIFVASVIASIFRSDPKEYPGLKAILVFDEVHRLLPKFGGSGEGFLQIERACREFRKWGMGVMLVSQVLSDFVGEIKANINTEIQMRTRDEADLNRLKTKYGEEVLQSLIKASVGVGMFVNPSYNKGKPYFIHFRPILHNTRRLSDEILDKYNQYGDQIDDIDYQIEQLEKEQVDVFDIKMELKLVKDKLMTGNFTVVDIYLEGLKPRVVNLWDKLGKKPKKRELELVSETDIKASLATAQKEREKFENLTKQKTPITTEKKEENNKVEVGKEKQKVNEQKEKNIEKNEIQINSNKQLEKNVNTETKIDIEKQKKILNNEVQSNKDNQILKEQKENIIEKKIEKKEKNEDKIVKKKKLEGNKSSSKIEEVKTISENKTKLKHKKDKL